MVNYKAIADAIPKTELDAALAELAIERPLIKKEFESKNVTVRGKIRLLLLPVLDSKGEQKTKQVVDESDKPITAKGKFMDDTLIKAAFDAIKDKIHNTGTVEEPIIVLDFPNLKVGHVQNAIQARAKGEI